MIKSVALTQRKVECEMPDWKDYHAFTSTTSHDSGANPGCSGCLPWVLGILAIVWFIGRIAA